MTLIDVSVPLRPGMIHYPGDPELHLERVLAIARGDPANVSRLDFGVHSGTHVDAPNHFLDGEPGVDSVPLDVLVGPAQVVDGASLPREVSASALQSLAIPDAAERLLLKTRNSALWERDSFSEDSVSLDESGARWLVERGVRLIGIDYLSIGDEAAHQVLLRAGVVPLEGLDLRQVEPGSYRLICLPLRIEGSDGGPARVLLETL